MTDIWQQIVTAWQAQSILEVVAVVTAVLYLVLAIKENIWCWLFAFISTALSIVLFYSVMLFSEALLNVFYLVMAVFGWWKWSHSLSSSNGKKINKPIQKWPLLTHLKSALVTLLFVPILGFFMQQQGADFAYLDAFTSCFAVFTTFLVVQKVFENWYYWIVVDGLSVYLYWQKGLYLYSLLFILYLILVLIGIRQWSISYAKQHTS